MVLLNKKSTLERKGTRLYLKEGSNLRTVPRPAQGAPVWLQLGLQVPSDPAGQPAPKCHRTAEWQHLAVDSSSSHIVIGRTTWGMIQPTGVCPGATLWGGEERPAAACVTVLALPQGTEAAVEGWPRCRSGSSLPLLPSNT